MRFVFGATCLLFLLFAELPVATAQAQEEDGDDDDGSEGVNQLAQQLKNEYADAVPQAEVPEKVETKFAPIVEDAVPQTAVPEKVETKFAPIVDEAEPAVEPSTPQGPSMPQEQPSATINMAASSLNRFGQQHVAAPAPAAKADAKESKEPTKKAQVAADAENAHKAAETAKNAAEVANKVATHSIHLTDSAKSALKSAHEALHNARVDSAGLSGGQKKSLKAAEAKLREATKKAEYGSLKNAKYVKAEVENKQLQKLEKKMDKVKKNKKEAGLASNDGELEAMRKEIEDLRKELKKKQGDQADDDAMLKELQDQIKQMEKEDKKDDKHTKNSHDEMKAEIERLRSEIKDMQDDEPKVVYKVPDAPKPEPVQEKEEQVEKYSVKMKPLKEEQEEAQEGPATPVENKGIDIDTAMPYGDLEPFGREDTAQELTENSIKESDGMVDQLERAEVAEEKRSVFRALTRLRGAAITSFDGVARSQTGNIDEYNKIHKWRNNHPLHHLADEESDVSKWAFPENAD